VLPSLTAPPAPFDPESLVGATLDARYRITGHVASGGMGAIFRAEHVYMRKELALKVLRPDLSTLPDIAERFRREAEIAASLEHENIVRVSDFGRTPEGWLFLAMELLEGESLFERLRRAGPLAPQEAVGILVQVCRGLEAAHARGVVHRDLKPENVFLVTRPAGLVKVLDFGIAKITDPGTASDTQAGIVVGTPEYLSPEQATGATVDGRADVYAVGLVAWRMLAGRHPFQADDARGLLMMQATRPVPPLTDARPDLVAWPGLLAAVARACAKEACERHASAAELRAEFEACLGSLEMLPGVRASEGAPSRWTTLARPAETLPLGDETATLVPELSLPRSAAPRATARARALALLRGHPILAAVAAVALVAPAAIVVARWVDARPAAHARALLDAGRPDAARELVAAAVAQRPADARLRVLQGRALHRVRGEATAGVDAYAVALDLDPDALDRAAFADLVSDLAKDQDPAVAQRAAALLVRAGRAALPTVLAATRSGSGIARLRALEVARQLGAEERADPLHAYGALLVDDDCEVRRAAARRLGDLGNRDALPGLGALARDTRSVQGLFGLTHQAPACGADEAREAIQRIQAR
jgi:serine/threonine-protein kinase